MTDATLPRYHELNALRPANASFGEVVCVELYINGESQGYNKRKSIHVPASSNAYWNFIGLRSLAVSYTTKYGVERRIRDSMYLAIDRAVRWIHENELMLTYEMGLEASVQYYDLHISVNPGMILGVISATQGSAKLAPEILSVVIS